MSQRTQHDVFLRHEYIQILSVTQVETIDTLTLRRSQMRIYQSWHGGVRRDHSAGTAELLSGRQTFSCRTP